MSAKKILVIDDERETLLLIAKDLQASQYQVVVADNGEAGVQQAACEAPDLIILDIMMPKMDGFSVLHHLRKNPGTSETPVIILSARGDTQSIIDSQNRGATDYLIKPFDSEDLLKTIHRYLGDAPIG